MTAVIYIVELESFEIVREFFSGFSGYRDEITNEFFTSVEITIHNHQY